MIAHHSAYARIYKKHWIAAMILFCWVLSYGMQLPTFFKVWGKLTFDIKFPFLPFTMYVSMCNINPIIVYADGKSLGKFMLNTASFDPETIYHL